MLEQGQIQKVESTKKTTRRVQMELGEEDFRRLLALKEVNAAKNYSDVLKEALRLYDFILSEEFQGSKFYTKEKDGELVRIRIFK